MPFLFRCAVYATRGAALEKVFKWGAQVLGFPAAQAPEVLLLGSGEEERKVCRSTGLKDKRIEIEIAVFWGGRLLVPTSSYY